MKKSLKIVIGVIVGILIISLFIFSSIIKNKKVKNPKGVVGNTSGNIYNGGAFCVCENTIFFANVYDNNTLYSMNLDGKHIKKLTDVPVCELNAANGYVYYYQTDTSAGSDLGSVLKSTGIYRVKANGKEMKCLKKCTVASLLLVDNNLYFQYNDKPNGFVFATMDVNGNHFKILDSSPYSPGAAIDGTLFYHANKNNHNLMRYNTRESVATILYSGNGMNPVYQDNCIYYIDLDTDYYVRKLDLASGTVTTIVEERVDAFVVGDRYVYYQTVGKSPALKRAAIDGSYNELIAYGTYTRLSYAGGYAYYVPYNDPSEMLRTEDSSFAGTAEPFEAAKKAVKGRK